MGQHGGQGIASHLDGIASQTHAAPKYNALPVRLTLQKEPDDLVNAEIRYEAPATLRIASTTDPAIFPRQGAAKESRIPSQVRSFMCNTPLKEKSL